MGSRTTVNAISYDKSNELKGNTKIYRGWFGQPERDVAVKKLFCGSDDEIQKRLEEVKNWMKCDRHENVVSYFATETDDDFIYIAMELCLGNLGDWMSNQIVEIQQDEISRQEVLRQATEGVAHLHAKGIIHRKLKPTNILLVQLDDRARTVRVKIADFEVSRELQAGRTSRTATSGSDRMTGWKAPEVLRAQSGIHDPSIREAPATDIFSLGCIFYYVLSGGNHPFGNDPVGRDPNIKNYRKSMDVNHFNPLLMGNFALLDEMIANDRTQRPTTDYILGHHIFWTEDEMLNFLFDICKIFEAFDSNEVWAVKRELEQNFSVIAENCLNDPEGWLSLTRQIPRPGLCPVVQNYLINGPTRYSGNKIVDLYRAIYNLGKHEYNTTLPQDVKIALGPGNHINYWLPKFPLLVSTLWTSCKILRTTYNIERYYKA